MSRIGTRGWAIGATITAAVFVVLGIAAELGWLWQAGPIRGTLLCGLALLGLAWFLRRAED